jgi:MFS family permease
MRWILPTIVVSQFFCTSLWFAGNAVLPDIIKSLDLESGFLANLTSAVQFGFISGTLVFALLSLADRFSPSQVFFSCSIVAGITNLGICIEGISVWGLLATRFCTGFFLAGIYPVGMKIAADHYQKGLGKSLGFLVGALVLGTAFPHFLKSVSTDLPWKYVIYSLSGLSFFGGSVMLALVPNGPFRRSGQGLRFTAFLSGFENQNFRSAAFGYFGHMWELYTFWAFVPVMLTAYQLHFPEKVLNVPFLSFLIIAFGSMACVISGYLSQSFGTKKIATLALGLSCLCCFGSPFFLYHQSLPVFIIFLFFWGLVVIADSPLFSTLIAQNAPEATRGTMLTLVNCIGFSITIVSIQCAKIGSNFINPQYLYLFLALGPLIGIAALMRSGNF